jgi:hypothetical protein
MRREIPATIAPRRRGAQSVTFMTATRQQDPMDYVMNAERTRARAQDLLELLGATKAMGFFSGGNDEGGMDYVYLEKEDGTQEQIHEWATAKWEVVVMGGRPVVVQYQPLIHPRQTLINQVYGLLWAPIEDRFGSFAGEGDVSGKVVLDETGEVHLDMGYDEGFAFTL